MSKRKPKRTRSKAAKPKAAKRTAKKKRAATPARRATSRARKRTTATRRGREGPEDKGRTVGLLREMLEHHETGPAASAGDLDADWQRAQSSGEEAAGGSVSTPDQDRVDDIGHALGVEQPAAAPLRTTEEILADRDRRYWELERRAERKAVKRREP
jgi:hypothetical protein